jgi:hypothetical protein
MKSIALILFASLIATLKAYKNTPPIPDRLPGWSDGQGKLMIEFDLYTDLLCDGCAMLHEEFN